MKQCDKCRRVYGDEMTFCLEDGTALSGADSVPQSEPATHIRPVPAAKNSSTTKIVLIGIAAVALLGLGAVVIGIGGILFYASKKADQIAQASTPKPTPYRTPAIAVPTPSTWSTPPPPTLATPVSPNNKAVKDPPKQVSVGVMNGKATNFAMPPYPPAARAVRASGAVNVQVLVDETGRVVTANAVSGHPLLRNAAVTAARGVVFTPTVLAGQPVKVAGVLVYNFKPE